MADAIEATGGSEPEGREFESLRARISFNTFNDLEIFNQFLQCLNAQVKSSLISIISIS